MGGRGRATGGATYGDNVEDTHVDLVVVVVGEGGESEVRRGRERESVVVLCPLATAAPRAPLPSPPPPPSLPTESTVSALACARREVIASGTRRSATLRRSQGRAHRARSTSHSGLTRARRSPARRGFSSSPLHRSASVHAAFLRSRARPPSCSARRLAPPASRAAPLAATAIFRSSVRRTLLRSGALLPVRRTP